MFDRILKRMRDKVRTREYVVTLHAEEEIDDDELTVFDVERAVLTGTIVGRQRDPVTREWKYLVKGPTTASDTLVIVAKLTPTGKLAVITVYRE